MYSQFKLNYSLDSDWYSFKADVWYTIAGDLLETNDSEELKSLLRDFCLDQDFPRNPKYEDLFIELR